MVARIDIPSGSDPSRLADSGPGLGPFVAISVVYLLAILVGSWFLGHFEQVEALAPDQWGNVLAGIFSPLAFLWLIYASLSQRTELSLQRYELQENNTTQQLQQEQMSRQADALLAQVEALQKQANATYEPIFVLTRWAGADGGPALATILNVGNDALNVESVNGQALESIDGTAILGTTLSQWRRGSEVVFSLDDTDGREDYMKLALTMQRLDLERLTLEFSVCISTERLVFVRREPPLPGQPTPTAARTPRD